MWWVTSLQTNTHAKKSMKLTFYKADFMQQKEKSKRKLRGGYTHRLLYTEHSINEISPHKAET